MRNIKLTLAYDGTDFKGWQIQPNVPTVQGHLVEVLCKITQENIWVHGAGRTDAGVHALGQVAHFKTQSQLPPAEFQRALNSLLPATIRVLHAEEVAPEFHARHHAIGKIYHYRIFRGRVLPPFIARYALHYPGTLNEDAMSEAAAHFIGEHDFTSFAGAADEHEHETNSAHAPSPVRVIYESQITRSPAPVAADYELVYRIRGRSFLRYMVRKITGTLLDVGRGRFNPSDIPALLAARDPARSGATLSPHGLFMEAVEYPPPRL